MKLETTENTVGQGVAVKFFPIVRLLGQNRIYGVLFDHIVGFGSIAVLRSPVTSVKAKQHYYSAEIFKATTYTSSIFAKFKRAGCCSQQLR